MKRADGIPLGRTNLPEMGSWLDTDNPLRGNDIGGSLRNPAYC